jgi:RNA polymerase sigma-70 factor (ECF subfamily)
MTDELSTFAPRTRGTLLSRIRDVTDQVAWEEFVNDYGPRILYWCSRQGLQEADCADVVQTVLSRLVVAMRTFEYNPSKGLFRGWLKTVTRNAVADFVKLQSRPGGGSGDPVTGRLLEAVQDAAVVHDLSEILEQQAQIELLREAEARIQLKVKPVNWEAWRLTVKEELQAPEVAQQTGLAASDVYVARSRISKMIREEIERMSGSSDSTSTIRRGERSGD